MIGLDAKEKKGNSLLVFGLVVKKKKIIFKFLADSVFLKENFFFGCFCFLKGKKKGSCFLKRKKKRFLCFKNYVVSVLRNSVF